MRQFRVPEIAIGFFFATAIWIVVLLFALDPATYHKICESHQYGHERCTAHNLLYVIWWYGSYAISASAITALATAFIAWFTLTLRQSTDRLWDAGERQLRALRENAEQQSGDMQASIRAAQAANILTRQIFVAEQRPWLGWSVPAIATLERNGPHLRIGIDGSLTNLGRLPATNISYFGRLYVPPPAIAAINLGQTYFAEHMSELQTLAFSWASVLPRETIPMRFGPEGIEIDKLPSNFTLWLAFHARYMFAIGGAPNPKAIAEIGTIYMVQPIGAKSLAFEKESVISAKTQVGLVEFPGARLLT